MLSIVIPIICVIVTLVVAIPVSFLIFQNNQKKVNAKKIGSAEEQARQIIDDAVKNAEAKKREALLEAKEENLRAKNDLEQEIRERRSEISKNENRIMQKEENLDRKIEAADKREANFHRKEDELRKKESELEKISQQRAQELERISGLTSEQAKEMLLDTVKADIQIDAAKLIKETLTIAKEEANKKAKDILVTAIQKCSADHVAEATISVVQLPSDEMKGRIIGREGRNIRTLETLTGVELIVDDTPEAVVLSAFDPVRREIARVALEKLIVDGRIHPARIEEMVNAAKREVDNTIREAGEEASLEVGVHGLNPELIKLLGRMKFRTSYGQNGLKHSIEVAELCGLLAAEVGVDTRLAKRAGLLHDIGKSIDREREGSHVQLGVETARKYKESREVIHAIEAHHDDVVANTIEAVLVKVADAISAGRPGARRDTLEIYIKRLQKIEEIVNSYEGIKQSFAVQAGREVRIIVQAEMFDDLASGKLARDVAKRIENELDYPGQIKVTVVREFRTTEIAR